jgi:hypothetical protein
MKGTKDGFNLYRYAKDAILKPIMPIVDQWSINFKLFYIFLITKINNLIILRKKC